MGENICISYIRQKVNIQDMESTLSELHNKKQPREKMGTRRYFPKEGKMANRPMKKVFITIDYQGNANQNSNDISPHTSQKSPVIKCLVGMC